MQVGSFRIQDGFHHHPAMWLDDGILEDHSRFDALGYLNPRATASILLGAESLGFYVATKSGETAMNCVYCGKPIVLVPSAADRARRYGGTPAHYTSLFTSHADCLVSHRQQEARELCERIKADSSRK